MMGVSHAASGAAVGAGVMALVRPADPAVVAVFVGLVAVSALLPDLDHPDAKMTRWLGPAGWLTARVLEVVGGGHRGLTHSFLGLGLASVGLVPVAAFTSVTWWHACAVVLGCAVHVAGDALTEYGVPLWWPNRRRYRIGTLNTGSWVETWVFCPAFVVVAGLASYAAVAPTT